MIKLLIFSVLILSYSSLVLAEPLGAIPAVEEGDAKLSLKSQSDLWLHLDQDKKSPIHILDLGLKIPIWQNAGWKTSITASNEALNLGRAEADIGNHPVYIGTNLQSRSVGFGLEKQFEKESALLFFGFYDSSSNMPYHTEKEVSKRVALAFKFARLGDDQWIIGAERSDNRGYMNGEILPSFGVARTFSKKLIVFIGFPFVRVNWDDLSMWKWRLRLSPVGSDSEIEMIRNSKISLYSKMGLSTRGYANAHRAQDDLRLFYEEKFLEIGYRIKVNDPTTFSFFAGFSMDRKFYEGKQSFKPIGKVQRIDADVRGGLSMVMTL